MIEENEQANGDDEGTQDDGTDDENYPDELTMLKARAKMIGVEFSNNIRAETLRNRINAKLEGEEEDDEVEEEKKPEPKINALDEANPKRRKLTLRQYVQNKDMKLVRLRITNMDPKKKDLPGEILTVANEYLGTVRKFVPYGEVTENGYHVPHCLYRMMDKRKFLNITTTRDRRTGTQEVKQSWVKEFALEVLPPLTEDELARLATAQLASGSTTSD